MLNNNFYQNNSIKYELYVEWLFFSFLINCVIYRILSFFLKTHYIYAVFFQYRKGMNLADEFITQVLKDEMNRCVDEKLLCNDS